MSLRSQALSRIRATYDATMNDACQLSAPDATQAADGQLARAWTFSAIDEIACGFEARGGRVVGNSDGSPIYADARLRLPAGTVVDVGWHVLLTQRFGIDLDVAVEYAVCAPPSPGVAGIVAELQQVTP